MATDQQLFEELAHRFVEGRLTAAEVDRFAELLQQEPLQQRMAEMIDHDFREQKFAGLSNPRQIADLYEIILLKTGQNNQITKPITTITTVHRIHFLKTAWFRYAAAIMLIAGLGVYLLLAPKRSPQAGMTGSELAQGKAGNGAGSNKAILTLADGSQIILDNSANGNIAQQGATKIIKLDDGQLAYENRPRAIPTDDPTGRNRPWPVLSVYNTVTTPRGGQYQIILPDGSKVWLNAVSSIKFPTTFTGATRSIEVTGEVYMEIAKNAKQPFLVKANGTEVQVLGTAFNINAYSDEKSIKTTLIEGSIRVKRLGAGVLLAPGQQAVVDRKGDDRAGGAIRVQAIDIAQVIAWKNGLFNFEGLGVKEVMNQLQRWYDIEVVYEAIPDIRFFGEIHKNASLSVALEAIKDIGVHFRMEGERKLVISQ